MKDEAELTHHTSIGNKEFTYKLKKVSGMNGRTYPLLIYLPDQLLTYKLKKFSGMSGRIYPLFIYLPDPLLTCLQPCGWTGEIVTVIYLFLLVLLQCFFVKRFALPKSRHCRNLLLLLCLYELE